MRVFITGQKGYLGRRFIQKYGSDYEVVGFDLIDGDNLLEYENVRERMSGCDQVVHLAAIPKPVEGETFESYFKNNVEATLNVARAATENKLQRIIYASSTTIYGIERGIPFRTPIREDQKFVSQYLSVDDLSCRDVDLSYHMSKVMAEQIMAWYGLNRKIQTVALRFGPIGKVFLETSVSDENAVQAIKRALDCKKELWYEAFSIVDDVAHIDISKAKKVLGYKPEKFNYSKN